MRKAMRCLMVAFALALCPLQTFGQAITRNWVVVTDLGPVGLMTAKIPDKNGVARNSSAFFFGPLGSCSLQNGRIKYDQRPETPYLDFGVFALIAVGVSIFC